MVAVLGTHHALAGALVVAIVPRPLAVVRPVTEVKGKLLFFSWVLEVEDRRLFPEHAHAAL
jgi:hypothetical protein